jgi:hypothetical protein
MKRVVNVLHVPNVEPKGKSTTPNPTGANIITNFKKKKNTTKNGDPNNSKNVRMSIEIITTKYTPCGVLKMQSTVPGGTEPM